MFITYQMQNGVLYATLTSSFRDGKKIRKTYQTLGRVLDKEKGIYKSRQRGVFRYDLQSNTYDSVEAGYTIPEIHRKENSRREKLILDFGASFFLNEICGRFGINRIVSSLSLSNRDTFMALLFYYVQCRQANQYASDWFEGDYARILFPGAQLEGYQVSRFLEEIGGEQIKREFFFAYLAAFPCLKSSGNNILIDSTGLPNAIHFPLTALSTHNGVSSEEVRLTYVAQTGTTLPIYFQYDAGNILDKNLLMNVSANLEGLGFNAKEMILDAGYSSLANLEDCMRLGMDFVTRLGSNLVIYKEAVEAVHDKLEEDENATVYGHRLIYVRKVPVQFAGSTLYLYVGADNEEKQMLLKGLLYSKKARELEPRQISRMKGELGRFVLASSKDMGIGDIIPYYYKRQEIEQLFDVCKNYTKILPLRVHKEETFRGHILMTFLASAVLTVLQQEMVGQSLFCGQEDTLKRRGKKAEFKEPSFNRIGMFLKLRNHKCNVYDTKIVPAVPAKEARDIYSFFKIEPITSLARHKQP